MKSLILVLLASACVGGVRAQDMANVPSSGPLPNLPDDTVVAIFDDGARLTMGEFRQLAAALPEQTRNREVFFRVYAMSRKLAKMAEEDKLDQESPWKEILEYNRLMILAQAKNTMAISTITVDPGAVAKYYAENKDKFKQVRVKAIYIAFGGKAAPTGRKALTEEQAEAKAEKLLAASRHGADFVKLVKENSDDEISRAKDGDFATVRPGDRIPDAMREAVFSLKPGEVSEPVRQPNGYYLFRAEEVTCLPLPEVRDQIFAGLKKERIAAWLKQVEPPVRFPNPQFLATPEK